MNSGRVAPFFVAVLAVSALLLSLLLPADAHAGGWTEVHQTSDDVRVSVGADGVAIFEYRMRWRIVAGKFRSLDVGGIDLRAALEPEATVSSEKGGDHIARVERDAKAPDTVHIFVDAPAKWLGRGVYLVDIRYKLDLVAAKILTRDGGMWRLAWTAPPALEGRDGARVVFELPTAPTEPRLANAEQVQTTLATLRRLPDGDELELVRAHVPRGEAVTWAARVDPKAFPAVTTPELRPPPPPAQAARAADRTPAGLAAIALATIAGLLAFLMRSKHAAFERACALSAARPVPLVPMPGGSGPFAFGACVALAGPLLMWSSPLAGAAAVVVAGALAVFRGAAPLARPRGPGKWQKVPDDQILVPRPRGALPGDFFDAHTNKGRLVALFIVAAVGLAAWLLRLRVAGIALALPLASVSLVPIFTTGTRAQLPATPAELASCFLRPARDALARLVDLAHVELGTIGRFVREKDIDEARLACVPIDRMPGLRAVELAFAAALPGGRAALPEVLVRYDDGSAAAARIAALVPGAPVVPGRGPEEKVLRLAPEDPSPQGAARLLARLLVELEGRRATDRTPEGPEGVPLGIAFAGPERRVRRAVTAAAA